MAPKNKKPIKWIKRSHSHSNSTQSAMEKLALALKVEVIDLYRFIEQSETIIR